MKSLEYLKKIKEEHKSKYEKPVSLYPLKPEDALEVFMKVDPKKIKKKTKDKKQ